jgi:lauroyl/myristoyl acyltransferase
MLPQKSSGEQSILCVRHKTPFSLPLRLCASSVRLILKQRRKGAKKNLKRCVDDAVFMMMQSLL